MNFSLLLCVLLALGGGSSLSLKEFLPHIKKTAANLQQRSAEETSQAAFDIAADVIRNNHNDIGRSNAPLSSSNTCTISADGSETCPISAMAKDETTIVLTSASGDGSQCIFGDSYGFQVIPGDSDKLLFYFQGGGACWDKVTTAAGMCTTNLSPNAPVGVFDRTNSANPFASYTVVHALYCSGDVWAGNVTAPYTHLDKPVVQVGVQNTLSTIAWVQAQIAAGSIGDSANSGRFNEFVTMGCSAGSVGAQLWADQLISTFPAKQVAVVPDSYAGVFPPGSVGPLMHSFGVCDTIVMPENLRATCNDGALEIEELVFQFISKYPQYPFAFIQSKIDAVQQSFYVAVGLTTKGSSAIITPKRFYEGVNGIFGSYNTLPNFVTYLVDGPMHCFTPMNIMYDTTNYGPYGKRDVLSKEKVHLSKWLANFPLSSGNSVTTQCVGPSQVPTLSGSSDAENTKEEVFDILDESVMQLQKALFPNQAAEEEGGLTFGNRFNAVTKYCNPAVSPKSFTQEA